MTKTYMSGDKYKRAVEAVGLLVGGKRAGAQRFFGVDETTSRRWRAGTMPIPKAVAMLLTTMVRHRLSVAEVERGIAGSRLTARPQDVQCDLEDAP